MGTLDEKSPTWAPAYMVGIYPRLAEEARRLGYALALHGSLQRDLDVIAVPWRDDAAPAVDLVHALSEIFDIEPNHPIDEPQQKPHGRLGWSIPLWWGAYVDLSVMPRVEAPKVKERPRRVQLSRAKGWRMPENTVKVARPTKWGNPYTVAECGRELAVLNYKRRLDGLRLIGALDLSGLRGKNLACWCRLDEPCHADVLLEYANSDD